MEGAEVFGSGLGEGNISAADGSYTVLLRQGRSIIRAAHSSADPALNFPLQNITLQVDGPMTYDIHLRRGFSVAVHLVDPQGQHINAANIWMDSPHGSGQGLTSAEGRATLQLVPGLYGLSLFSPPRPFVGTAIHPIPIAADTAFQVVLQPGHTINGLVTDTSGRPFFNSQLTFFPSHSPRTFTAQLDVRGDFELRLPPGVFTAVFTTSLAEGSPNQVLGRIAVDGDASLDFVLDPGTRLSGLLLTATGQPLADGLVLAQSPTQQGRATTSADGVFELFIEPGEYDLFLVEVAPKFFRQ